MNGHYNLHVCHGQRLSAANKRSIKNAARVVGLVHPSWSAARMAAVDISLLPAVRHVAVEHVVGMGIYVRGKKVKS